MNPHRRVGVLPDESLKSKHDKKAAKATARDSDDKTAETEGPMPHESHLARLNWQTRIDLGRINRILAIVYITVGSLILFGNLFFFRALPFHSGTSHCIYGHCFARDITLPMFPKSFRHASPSAFHPYAMHTLLMASVLIAYGLSVWFNLTITIINLGHMFNWTAFLMCLLGTVQSFYHHDSPIFASFHSPFSFLGVIDALLEPFLFLLVTLCCFAQAILNAPTLITRSCHFYPNVATWEPATREQEQVAAKIPEPKTPKAKKQA